MGEYGSATKEMSIPEFLHLIEPYHPVLATWKVLKEKDIRNSIILFDGIDSIGQTNAWDQLISGNQVEIVFNGDRIYPSISTSDILLRSIEFFFKQSRRKIDEKTIKEIVLFKGIIPDKNVDFFYLGNPDLKHITPVSDKNLWLSELNPYIKRPIFFLSAGGIPGQKDIIEGTEAYENAISKAIELNGCLKFYNPKKDRLLIGVGPKDDYFYPANSMAEQQLQALQTSGGKMIKRFP